MFVRTYCKRKRDNSQEVYADLYAVVNSDIIDYVSANDVFEDKDRFYKFYKVNFKSGVGFELSQINLYVIKTDLKKLCGEQQN